MTHTFIKVMQHCTEFDSIRPKWISNRTSKFWGGKNKGGINFSQLCLTAKKTRNENERQYRMEQAVAGLLQVCSMKIFFNSHAVKIFVEIIFRIWIYFGIWEVRFKNFEKETLSASHLNSNMSFLRNEFSKIFEDLFTMTLLTEMAHIIFMIKRRT